METQLKGKLDSDRARRDDGLMGSSTDLTHCPDISLPADPDSRCPSQLHSGSRCNNKGQKLTIRTPFPSILTLSVLISTTRRTRWSRWTRLTVSGLTHWLMMPVIPTSVVVPIALSTLTVVSLIVLSVSSLSVRRTTVLVVCWSTVSLRRKGLLWRQRRSPWSRGSVTRSRSGCTVVLRRMASVPVTTASSAICKIITTARRRSSGTHTSRSTHVAVARSIRLRWRRATAPVPTTSTAIRPRRRARVTSGAIRITTVVVGRRRRSTRIGIVWGVRVARGRTGSRGLAVVWGIRRSVTASASVNVAVVRVIRGARTGLIGLVGWIRVHPVDSDPRRLFLAIRIVARWKANEDEVRLRNLGRRGRNTERKLFYPSIAVQGPDGCWRYSSQGKDG